MIQYAAGREAENVGLYRCRIFFPMGLTRRLNSRILSHLKEPVDVVIGCDLLQGARLIIDFTTGRWEIHFKPALSETPNHARRSLRRSMTDLWDRPPIPKQGDAADSATYEAMGRALCEWERMEVALAYLYSVFTWRGAFDLQGARQYGRGRIFKERMDGLEDVARRFFIQRHHQDAEGDFGRLVCRVRKFADRRNDIAHGIVTTVRWHIPVVGETVGPQAPQFYLLPAFYDPRRAQGHMPDYAFNAEIITCFGWHFEELGLEVGRQRHFAVQLA